MTVRMGLIRKKADWSSERFDAYWRDTHGPLAAQVPGLQSYWQNLVTDRLQRGITFKRGPWDFDGFSQLGFGDAPAARDAFGTSDLGAALVADEQHFLGDVSIVTAEQIVVVPVPPAPLRGTLLKRISLITRLPSLGEADFRREWQVHGEHVSRMPGIGGYRQNVVLARERHKGTPCGHAELPIDGIVEFWFDGVPTLEAAFASPAGRTTMAHADTFLSEITAFVVAERRIA